MAPSVLCKLSRVCAQEVSKLFASAFLTASCECTQCCLLVDSGRVPGKWLQVCCMQEEWKLLDEQYIAAVLRSPASAHQAESGPSKTTVTGDNEATQLRTIHGAACIRMLLIRTSMCELLKVRSCWTQLPLWGMHHEVTRYQMLPRLLVHAQLVCVSTQTPRRGTHLHTVGHPLATELMAVCVGCGCCTWRRSSICSVAYWCLAVCCVACASAAGAATAPDPRRNCRLREVLEGERPERQSALNCQGIFAAALEVYACKAPGQ